MPSDSRGAAGDAREDGPAVWHARAPRFSAEIRCEEPADLTWLRQFLGPAFGLRPKPRAHDPPTRVLFDRSTAAWGAYRGQRARVTARRRGLFYLDTRIERVHGWTTAAGRTVLEAAEEAWIVVDPSERTVRIVGRPGERLARLTLMRVVRELAAHGWYGPDSLMMHGASFLTPDGAVLVSGRKRSGKTSLLLHSLRSELGRYLGNDRALLTWSGSGSMRLRPVPTIVSIRTFGSNPFPDLTERIRNSGCYPVLTWREASSRVLGPALPWKGGRYTLSPAQLCRILGRRRSASGPLRAVVFPRVTGEPGGIRATRLPAGLARARIVANAFRARSSRKSGSLLAMGAPARIVSDSETRRRAVEVAACTPCFDVALGLEAYRDPEWTRVL